MKDYHNIFAREQLLLVANEINALAEKVKSNADESDADQEYSFGARAALLDAVGLVYARIEKLQEDKK